MTPETGQGESVRAISTKSPLPAIPQHSLICPIGGGSYGEVWLARDVLGTYRAVKIVKRVNFRDDRPYMREFEGIRLFEPVSREHEGLVDILQVGKNQAEGYFYYIMELADDVSGSAVCLADPGSYVPKTLRSILKRPASGIEPTEQGTGALPFGRCIEIGIPLAAAVAHMHQKRLVHRDIKPSNIIFVNGMPKLADIGLVTGAHEQCSWVGTEGYVPPEGPGHPQADIYALGKVLYEMMTGFRARDYPKLPENWASSPELTEFNELNQVVLRACEAKSDLRYSTTEDLLSELRLLQNKKSVLRLRRLERANRRLKMVLAGLGVLLIVAALAGVMIVQQHRIVEENRHRVLSEIRLSRPDVRRAGWFAENWSRLLPMASKQADQEVLEQAMAMLAGPDGRVVKTLEHTSAASAAFGPGGRAVVSGIGADSGFIIDTNGAFTLMPIQGEGPVCWAPNGMPLEFVAISNQLVLRDARTARVVRTFSSNNLRLSRATAPPILAVSSGAEFVSAAQSGRVVVWDAKNGVEIGAIEQATACLSFAPDASLIGIGAKDGSARVYSLPSLTEVIRLPSAREGDAMVCLAFGRDPVVAQEENRTSAWLLATADQGTAITIWDIRRGLPRSHCYGSLWTVGALAFHPDGQTLASASRFEVRLWDIASGLPILRLPGGGAGDSRALSFDGDGRNLVFGGEQGSGVALFTLYQLERGHGVSVLRGLTSATRQLWFSEKGDYIAALSDDWHVAIWSLPSERLLFNLEVPTGGTADSAGGTFGPDNQYFAFAAGKEARVYDLQTARVLRRWGLAGGYCDHLQFADEGQLLLLRRERTLQEPRSIWRLFELADSPTPRLVREQTETNWTTLDVALPKGARRFLAREANKGSPTQLIHVYDTASGEDLSQLRCEASESFYTMRLDPSGQFLAYPTPGSLGQAHRLVSLYEPGKIENSRRHCAAIGPNRGLFDGIWLVPDRTAPERRIRLGLDWHLSSDVSSFGPDGKLFAWGTEEGVVMVANIQEILRRLSMVRH